MNTNESSRMTSNFSTTSRVKHKIIFLGDQHVGKTCIIERFMYDVFSEKSAATVGVDFLAKTMHIDEKNIRLQLWDTAGQERFRSLIPSYLRDATAAVVVFDVTKPESFTNVDSWIKEYRDTRGSEAACVLVANKIDLQLNRQVTTEEGQKKAKENNMNYFEISAKTGENVQDMFKAMAVQLQPQGGENSLINGTVNFQFDQNGDKKDTKQQQQQQQQQQGNTQQQQQQQPVLQQNQQNNQQQQQGQTITLGQNNNQNNNQQQNKKEQPPCC